MGATASTEKQAREQLLQEALIALERTIRMLGYCQQRFEDLQEYSDSYDLQGYITSCQKRLERLTKAKKELP